MVDRVVGDEGRKEKRRRLLSARFTVYFVLAMCLFPQADYLEVLRLVKAGESTLRPWTGVNKSSLTRARQRLGWTVMRELFRAVARPLGAGPELFCGMRVLALDGTLLAVPGSPGTWRPSASPARIEANKHSKAAGTVKAPPVWVRVIEYRVDGQTDVVRLITSLLDHPAISGRRACGTVCAQMGDRAHLR
ncbi:transposase domain-containing protein [Streptomyces malaysiensis subsp. malaysiensis]